MASQPRDRYRFTALVLGAMLAVPSSSPRLWAEEPEQASEPKATAAAVSGKKSATAEDSSSDSASEKKPEEKKLKYPPMDKVTKDLKPISGGMIKLYQGDEKLLAELKPGDLDQDFIVLISIAKGIGQTPMLGGYQLGIWRRLGLAVPQGRTSGSTSCAATSGSAPTRTAPSERAVKLAYTDSVLFSLPIVTKRPRRRRYVVDLTQRLHERPAADLDGAARLHLRRRQLDLGRRQGLPKEHRGAGRRDVRVERQHGDRHGARHARRDDQRALLDQQAAEDRLPAAAGRRSRGLLPDRRRRTSRRRRATTTSSATSTAGTCRRPTRRPTVSPPKKPIIFWLEKTVPFKYRKPIRDGIAEWNKAFEKAGFVQRDRGAAAAGRRRLGPGRHQLQHVPLDHRRAPASPWARRRVNPLHRPDPRRRHHLRRRLPAVLEDELRDLHAGGDRRDDRRSARPRELPPAAEPHADRPAARARRPLRVQPAARHVAPVRARRVGRRGPPAAARRTSTS